MTACGIAGQLEVALDSLVTDRVTPGYAAYLRVGGESSRLFGGGLDDAPHSPAPDASTVYDVASLTKVVATWGVVGRLVAQGLIALDDPVSRFFAEVHPGWAGHTLADLLLHRTRLPVATWLSQYGREPEAIRHGVLMAEPADRPAVPAQYLNRGFLVLGWVVEAVTGGRLAEVVEREWWRPSGLTDTRFDPLVAGVPPARIAPTEDVGEETGRLCGVVHDENARLLGGAAGHAGAFSTLDDLARFAMRLVDDAGSLGLSSDYLTGSLTPLTPWIDGRSRALGWWTSDDGRLVRHDGFTGTTICFAPRTGDLGVLLTNAVYFGRRNPRLLEVRNLLSSVVGGRRHSDCRCRSAQ